MQLTDAQLQEFKDRCLQAVFNNYTIALADEYMTALAVEVGQEIIPEGVSKASPQHLLGLATEALQLRAAGGRKTKAKKPEVKPEPKVEPKVETPITPPPAPEVKVEEPVIVPETEVVPETEIVPEVKAEPVVEPKVEEVKEAPKSEPAKTDDSKKSAPKKGR